VRSHYWQVPELAPVAMLQKPAVPVPSFSEGQSELEVHSIARQVLSVQVSFKSGHSSGV
jgi:hypothetical protein